LMTTTRQQHGRNGTSHATRLDSYDGPFTQPEERRVRAFRNGLMRRSPSGIVFKPAFLMGLSQDGGVFISPYQRSGAWQYGVISKDQPVGETSAETWHRPKVHYHRSGWVYATLSGQELEQRSLRLPELQSLRNSQIFSVMTLRTWELPSRGSFGDRAGDAATAVRRWPEVATWNIFLLDASEAERRPLLLPEMQSMGLLATEEYTHGIVSLSAYGREAILLITVNIQDSWGDLDEPIGFSKTAFPRWGGTTIAALPWRPEGPEADDQCFGVWSARLRNPLLSWATTAPADLTPTSTTSQRTVEDAVDRLAEFTVPEGGLGLRPLLSDPDDVAGTPFAPPVAD